MKNSCKKGLWITLGRGEDGSVVRTDFEKPAHLLIGGGDVAERTWLAEKIQGELANETVIPIREWDEFKEVVREAERRLALLRAENCPDLNAYEEKTGQSLKKMICVTESVSKWNALYEQEMITCMDVLGPYGRQAGVHMILVCDEKLPNSIRCHIPGRIAFKTANAQESMDILDVQGADEITEKYTFLFTKDGETVQLIHGNTMN